MCQATAARIKCQLRVTSDFPTSDVVFNTYINCPQTLNTSNCPVKVWTQLHIRKSYMHKNAISLKVFNGTYFHDYIIKLYAQWCYSNN